MRVTKAIREYVEEEINKKYHAVIDETGKDYEAEREDVKNGVLAIMKEANERALSYIAARGFDYRRGYFRYDDSPMMFEFHGNIEREEDEKALNAERKRLNDNMRAKVKQVLFDLEIGTSGKMELRDIIDSIEVE